MSSSPYVVHLPAFGRPGDPAALDRAEVVRDGFSWGACLVPGLWFLWHRHWLPALAAYVVVIGLALALWAVGTPAGTIVAAEVLLHLLFGFEGASLRRLDLAWRGRPATNLVIAQDTLDAEAKAAAQWMSAEAVPAAVFTQTDPRPVRPGYEPVIGLFPDREGRG